MIKKFISDLKKHLAESGQSNNSFAKEVGVSPSRITDWKNGHIKRYSKNQKIAHSIIRNFQKRNKQPIPEEVEDAVRTLLNSTNNPNEVVNLINSIKSFVKQNQNSQNTKIDIGK